MKSGLLGAALVASVLAGCQTTEQATAPSPVAASCIEARQRIAPLAAENEAFTRKVRRSSGRGVARASVDAGLSPEDAERRAAVIRELGALNEFSEQNRCPGTDVRRN